MSEEIAPCPFCGLKARLYIGTEGGGSFVHCHDRCCDGPCRLNREEAIIAWNRRAPSKPAGRVRD